MAKKILLVDDEASIRTVLVRIIDISLSEECEVIIVERSDGAEGLAYLREHGRNGSFPDLLITDLTMPNLRGEEMVAQAQAIGVCPDFFAISGDMEIPDFSGAPCVGVMNKPFTVPLLALRLRHYFGVHNQCLAVGEIPGLRESAEGRGLVLGTCSIDELPAEIERGKPQAVFFSGVPDPDGVAALKTVRHWPLFVFVYDGLIPNDRRDVLRGSMSVLQINDTSAPEIWRLLTGIQETTCMSANAVR